jgi:hypothetical protein
VVDVKKAEVIETLELKTGVSLTKAQIDVLSTIPLNKLKVLVKVAIAAYDNGAENERTEWEHCSSYEPNG